MKARKCDRCGGFYEIKLDEFDREIDKPEYRVYFGTTGNTVDLCSGCLNQFEAWMNMEESDGC